MSNSGEFGMALTPEQEQRLTCGGDCPDHFHMTDRLRTHNDVVALDALEDFIQITANYTFNRKMYEYVLADATAGNIALVLPDAKMKMKVTVVKTTAANTVTISALGTATINGSATYPMTAAYSKATFKAINGNYYVVA